MISSWVKPLTHFLISLWDLSEMKLNNLYFKIIRLIKMEEFVSQNRLENINKLYTMDQHPTSQLVNKLGTVSYIKNGIQYDGMIDIDGSTILAYYGIGSPYLRDTLVDEDSTAMFANASTWVKTIDDYFGRQSGMTRTVVEENVMGVETIMKSGDLGVPEDGIRGVGHDKDTAECANKQCPGSIKMRHDDEPLQDFDFSADNGDFDF